MIRKFNYRFVYNQNDDKYYIQRLYSFFNKKYWAYVKYTITDDDTDITFEYNNKDKEVLLNSVLKNKYNN
jgi:hypothetical protein